MAEQLIQSRSPLAYTGVQRYAYAHSTEDAGSLAWLALGYAHLLDHQCPQTLTAMQRAKAKAGVLSDYVDYFTADCQAATGDASAALKTLKSFDERHPGSLFSHNAAVVAANSDVATANPRAAIEMLQEHREPYRPEVELALARAEVAAGDLAAAAAADRRIYFSMPLAPEAAAAQQELDTLQRQIPLRPVSLEDRKLRANILLDRRETDQAIADYRGMLPQASTAELPELTLDLANALSQSGRSNDAKEALEMLHKMPDPGGELAARRLYYLLQLSRPDEKKVAELIVQLRNSAPQSPWFAEGLLATGNMYLLTNEYSTAANFFGELAQRFPDSSNAPYANWKTAWLLYRAGDTKSAQEGFERQIALYPESPQAVASLYWLGRMAEDATDLESAREYYVVAISRFQNEYYSELARERLHDLHLSGPPQENPLLEKISTPAHSYHFDLTPPEDNLHVQKSLLLENAGMTGYAIQELKAAGTENGENWTTPMMARLYTEAGSYNLALETLKRAAPGYYASPLSALPRAFWEELFPRPYWDGLKRYATTNQLDPFLVASLIRQESEFNPDAVSHAQAMGLMQLLPNTGRKLAHQVKLRHFNTAMLLDPNVNLELGTRYLRGLVDKYNGQLEYALAAYNAGPQNVDQWRNGHYRDLPEFVESIPFSETRDYVEAILRNQQMYSQLYRQP